MRNADQPLPAVERLLPHQGEMVLLDAVLACDDESVQARLTVRAGTPLSRPDGSLPASAGLELMGQGVAAWAGWQSHQRGDPVEVGFLLGTRHYRCNVPAFRPGDRICVHCRRSLEGGNGMSVFECRLETDDGTVLAEARLNVFKPPNVADYLREDSVD